MDVIRQNNTTPGGSPKPSSSPKYRLRSQPLQFIQQEFKHLKNDPKIKDNDPVLKKLEEDMLQEWGHVRDTSRAFFFDVALVCKQCKKTHWESYKEETLNSKLDELLFIFYQDPPVEKNMIEFLEKIFGEVKLLADRQEQKIRREGGWICDVSQDIVKLREKSRSGQDWDYSR